MRARGGETREAESLPARGERANAQSAQSSIIIRSRFVSENTGGKIMLFRNILHLYYKYPCRKMMESSIHPWPLIYLVG